MNDMSATRATRMQHKYDTSNKSEAQVIRMQHKRDTSATLTERVRHEWYTNDTSATRVKNLDFDNDTSKNIFSHPYICYMASERL